MMSNLPTIYNQTILPQETPILMPGMRQGVHITLEAAQLEWLLEKIEQWFDGRDEVILIDSGTSEKAGNGCIILEWDEVAIDPLFLKILEHEEMILDYAVYTRGEA